jgi:hypothetical protein
VLHQQIITTGEKMTSGELERSGQLTIANSLVQDILERPKKRMQISTLQHAKTWYSKLKLSKILYSTSASNQERRASWMFGGS